MRSKNAYSIDFLTFFLYDPFAYPLIILPVDLNIRLYDGSVQKLSTGTLSRLVGDAKEDQTYILWITKDGEVRMSEAGSEIQDPQFQFETFFSSYGYVGKDVGNDGVYCAKLEAQIRYLWLAQAVGTQPISS